MKHKVTMMIKSGGSIAFSRLSKESVTLLEDNFRRKNPCFSMNNENLGGNYRLCVDFTTVALMYFEEDLEEKSVKTPPQP